jgi:aryl-alcohol dehydrogenase-like predicted oxidoreductase
MMSDANFDVLNKLESFAEDHDHSVGELALAWLGSQPFVASVIAGATSPSQMEENVQALSWHLEASDMKALDEAIGSGPSAGRRGGGPGR